MNEATLQYVRQHADKDVRQLALRGSKDPEVDMTAALQQIAGRQAARRKLPSWAEIDAIVFPPHLNMEQCSSEQTARYKATVVKQLMKESSENSENSESSAPLTLLDLTGGFGVDFSFLAPHFAQSVYVEQQEELCRLARHNFGVLGIKAEVVCADGTEYLHQLSQATVIFLDPARRDVHGSRTYGIADCTPNVLDIKDELLQKSRFVMLKLSPMLDWRKAVSDLGSQYVREVHIVSVQNECKELLLLLSAEGHGMRLVCEDLPHHSTIFLITDHNHSEATGEGFPSSEVTENFPSSELTGEDFPSSGLTEGSFLYESNASIMKAGCFAELCQAFPVRQLAQNSHLFVSDRLIPDFPGRRFQIQAVSSMNKKELKQKLSALRQANITVRNFPLSVAELRKRLKLSDGGSDYLFATTCSDGSHVLIICRPPVAG